MANTIFIVNDKQTGEDTLVNAASKRKAEKLLESGRFIARKASHDEITAAIHAGKKILTEGPHVPASPHTPESQTATLVMTDGKALPNPAEAMAPLVEKNPDKNPEYSYPSPGELGTNEATPDTGEETKAKMEDGSLPKEFYEAKEAGSDSQDAKEKFEGKKDEEQNL